MSVFQKNSEHVLPTSDQIEHLLTEDCLCGPDLERVTRGDGSDGWIVIHHRLDGGDEW